MLPRAPPTPHSRPAAYDATENNPFDCEKRDYFPKRGKERELSLIIPLKGLFENTRDMIIKKIYYDTPCLTAASLWISENAFRFPVIVTKIGLIVLLSELNKKLRSSVSKLCRTMATTNHK